VVLDRLPRGSGVVFANINPAYQAGLRKSLPALKHRRIGCDKLSVTGQNKTDAAKK
jgi:nitrilase